MQRIPAAAIAKPNDLPPTIPRLSYEEPILLACPGPCPKPIGRRRPEAIKKSGINVQTRRIEIIRPISP